MDQVILNKVGRYHFLPSGEPVLVIRAQDQLAYSTALYWTAIAESAGVSQEVLKEAYDHALKMRDWPAKKLPD